MTFNKLFLFTFMLFILGSLGASNQDEIPRRANEMLDKHFQNVEILSVTTNNDTKEVTVALNNEMKIAFDAKGNWLSIKRKLRPYPKSFIDTLPKLMTSYIADKHPNKAILHISRDTKNYMIQLPEVILYFDLNGKIKTSKLY